MKELIAYSHLLKLFQDLNHYFEGRRDSMRMTTTRMAAVLGDVIRLMNKRSKTGPVLASDFKALFHTSNCLAVLELKYERADWIMDMIREHPTSSKYLEASLAEVKSWPGLPEELVVLLHYLPKFKETEFFR